MADNQTIVALNIGAQRISMAVFENSKGGGLLLTGYASDTIIADPAFEASREAQLKVVIDDLVGQLKVPKSKVRYAISGQSVFTRFVKLPAIQEDNLEQLVTFEAQQHVPFPIDEVVWDYELITGSEEKEVIIVAIKGEALDEINEAVTSSGLSTLEVDVAPMALYNSFRASYGTPEESTLLIDVGAKTSNLLYMEGERFFTRSVAIGGASVSSAIAKEYNITFPDAEHQKITNGLVALGGGHTETMEESLAALAMVIRNALTRLPAEISRTTNYFRSQHGGSAPKRVLLAGGGANLPYTLEFFTEKLGISVEYFNPLSQVAIGKTVDSEKLQGEAHTMGELVGLGLRAIGKSTINIDLVPAAVEVLRATDRRKPFLMGAAALLILGFAAWALFTMMAANKAENQTRTMVDIRDKLTPVETEIKGLLRTEQELKAIATEYTDLESAHGFWFHLFGELRGSLASDSVWLTDLTPVYSNSIGEKSGTSSSPAFSEAIASSYSGKTSGETSSIVEAPAPAPMTQKTRGSRNSPALEIPDPLPVADAVLIKGFWRENPKRQGIVSEMLNQLRQNTRSVFSFETVGENGEPRTLSDEEILTVSAVGDEGDLGFPFEIILPLATPVSVK